MKFGHDNYGRVERHLGLVQIHRRNDGFPYIKTRFLSC